MASATRTQTSDAPADPDAKLMTDAVKMLDELTEMEAKNPGVHDIPMDYTLRELTTLLEVRVRRLKRFFAERDAAK